MLAFSPSSSSSSKQTLTPNLLPAAIKHNGPIPFNARYWSPKETSATTNTSTDAAVYPSQPQPQQQQVSYLRGRRLLGRKVRLPENYTGYIVQKSDAAIPKPKPTAEELRRLEERLAGYGDEDEDEDEGVVGGGADVEVKMLEEKGRFEEVVVWGHESLPEEGEEGIVRGLGEWVGFAEAMHGYDEPELTSSSGT